MAGSLGNFAADMIRALGGKPTPAAQKLFSSWQRWEGGHTANAATWNPLNITQPGSGLPTINSVGVVSMPNYQTGVQRTASLIQSDYPALARAFRTGQVNFNDPGVQGDLNRWLSGKRTPSMTPYVSKIAKSYGQGGLSPVVSGGSPGGTTAAPAQAGMPVFDPRAYGQSMLQAIIRGGGRIDLSSLGSLRQSAMRMPDLAPAQADVIPSTPGQAAPLVQRTADWGGSKSVASQLRAIAPGLTVTSEKRDRQNTATGGVSDHWSGSLNSYAYDLGGSVKAMDQGARALLRRLGVNWNGGPIVLSKNIGNHRIQILYRTNVGGNHFDHIHIGVRKL